MFYVCCMPRLLPNTDYCLSNYSLFPDPYSLFSTHFSLLSILYLPFSRIMDAALSIQRMFFIPGYARKKRQGYCSSFVSRFNPPPYLPGLTHVGKLPTASLSNISWLPGRLITWLPYYLITWLPFYLITWFPDYLIPCPHVLCSLLSSLSLLFVPFSIRGTNTQ